MKTMQHCIHVRWLTLRDNTMLLWALWSAMRYTMRSYCYVHPLIKQLTHSIFMFAFLVVLQLIGHDIFQINYANSVAISCISLYLGLLNEWMKYVVEHPILNKLQSSLLLIVIARTWFILFLWFICSYIRYKWRDFHRNTLYIVVI